MPLEVEIKFPLSAPEALERRLAALGAAWGDPQVQVDLYLAHPSRDFARTDEALRLRRVGSSNMLTYKGPKLDAQTKTRVELELDMPAEEAGFQHALVLFQSLGFRPVREVKKLRRYATVNWRDREISVTHDAVSGLGDYVELEIVAEGDGEQARQSLLDLARELGFPLAASERRSYLELLLEREG